MKAGVQMLTHRDEGLGQQEKAKAACSKALFKAQIPFHPPVFASFLSILHGFVSAFVCRLQTAGLRSRSKSYRLGCWWKKHENDTETAAAFVIIILERGGRDHSLIYSFIKYS